MPGGKVQIQAVVVDKKPVDGLVGDIIKNAQVGYDNLGQPKIEFELTPDAGIRFGQVTHDNIGHRMAIVLDGDLVTAPNIQNAIETGSGEITGNYSMDEARAVANAMQNPLRAPSVCFTRQTWVRRSAKTPSRAVSGLRSTVSFSFRYSCFATIGSRVSRPISLC